MRNMENNDEKWWRAIRIEGRSKRRVEKEQWQEGRERRERKQ